MRKGSARLPRKRSIEKSYCFVQFCFVIPFLVVNRKGVFICGSLGPGLSNQEVKSFAKPICS